MHLIYVITGIHYFLVRLVQLLGFPMTIDNRTYISSYLYITVSSMTSCVARKRDVFPFHPICTNHLFSVCAFLICRLLDEKHQWMRKCHTRMIV
jgi:Na+/pantothenate symporter